MLASRPAGRLSASDVRLEFKTEGIPGSDPDRWRFHVVGGRETVVDVGTMRLWVINVRGGLPMLSSMLGGFQPLGTCSRHSSTASTS